MITCSACRQQKPESEFHLSRSRITGRAAYCKPCANSRAAVWQKHNPKRAASSSLRWNRANKEKQAAHAQVKQAIAVGVIQKKPCAVCENTASEAHHFDYSKPLEVIWLCRAHHCAVDRTGPRASKPYRCPIAIS